MPRNTASIRAASSRFQYLLLFPAMRCGRGCGALVYFVADFMGLNFYSLVVAFPQILLIILWLALLLVF